MRTHPFGNYLVRVAALALAYAVAGRLGLLLAIPPGYATAIWPAAGVALAGLILMGPRHWPGILLGSFLVNVWTSWDGSTTATLLRSLAIAVSIAGGATLQALVGEWLVRRFVGYRNILTQETDSVRLLLLGGPISCLVNAAVGPLTLWAADLIKTPELLFNMWTWWVGDSIGVLIFVPLICAWCLRPSRQWLRQQLSLTLPMLLLFCMVVFLFFGASAREELRIRAAFEKQADQTVEDFEKRWSGRSQMMDAIRGFFAASSSVTSDEFHLFVQGQLRNQPGLSALEYLPRVPQAERAAFELDLQRRGHPGAVIRETDREGHLQPAGPRPVYYPISYMEPPDAVPGIMGFDLASEAVRRQALERAIDTGATTITERVRLIGPIAADGVLVLTPLFTGTVDYSEPEERRRQVLGLVMAVFRIDAMAQASLGQIQGSGMRFRLFDLSVPAGPQLLYEAGPPAGAGGVAMDYARTFPVGGRLWRLNFELPAAYLTENRSWQTWGLLAAGLGLTGLLGLLLLVLLSRQTRVQELVLERTAELRAAEARLTQYAEDLERSNAELQQFAYVASHDLQAPLRSITGFSRLLSRDYKGRLDADADEFLDFISQGAARMQALISDLLALSRVGGAEAAPEDVDCAPLLEQVLQNLSAEIQARQAIVSHDALPTVRGHRGELLQLFQNLLGNAMKFQEQGLQPRVHVSAERIGREWKISVRDNGIGIAEEFHERIFQIFQRLHTTDQYEGTGIGLALCRKIVERHGGRLWVESSKGQGACFHFTLKASVN